MVLKSVSILTFGGPVGGFAKQLMLPMSDNNPRRATDARPVLLIKARNIMSVDIAEIVSNHLIAPIIKRIELTQKNTKDTKRQKISRKDAKPQR